MIFALLVAIRATGGDHGWTDIAVKKYVVRLSAEDANNCSAGPQGKKSASGRKRAFC